MQGIHRSILGRFRSWTHLHHAATALIVVFGLLIASGLTAFALLYHPPKPAVSVKTPVATLKPTILPAVAVFYSPLTGEKVPDLATTQAVVTGVMIENSPDARPQSGLKSAGVVYEAIAEGGITRFMALYQQEKPALIGPVRSLRIYDIDWLAPFQAGIAHVGGSAAALKQIRNGSYRDLDEFFNGSSFWRTTDRYAPHNVYTDFAHLDALNNKKGYTTSTFTAWPRKDDTPSKTPIASTINVTISSALYNSKYTYDAANNDYLRYQAGAPHLDREQGQISPKVVIVMDVHEQTVLQDGYREQITTIGTGRARIFQDGTVITGTWSKTDSGSQTKFLDGSGKEIPLNRGQTWITAVPVNRGGGVTWQ
jgi:hypothetical protein